MPVGLRLVMYLDGEQTMAATSRRLDYLITLAAGRTLLTRDRLRVIARLVDETRGLDGDMAELGTYRGGVVKVMAGAAPGKRLHVFDTFRGIPADDIFSVGHRQGEFAASEQEVRNFLAGTRAEFHVGTFPETTAGLGDLTFSLVHLDADTYPSTHAGIMYFWPRLVPGGILILDDLDWCNCPGVRVAVEELLPDVPVTVETRQQGWIRK